MKKEPKVLLVYPPNQLIPDVETPRPDGGLGLLHLYAVLRNNNIEVDLIDASITRAINLEHIQRATPGNLGTTFVVVLKIHHWPIGCIEALGKNAGNGGLTRAPWPGKEVRMGDSPRSDGIGQRSGDVLLPHHVGKTLRSIFSRYDLIGHGRKKPG